VVVLHDRVRLQESSGRHARELTAAAFLDRVLAMLDLEGQEVDVSLVGDLLFWVLKEHHVLKSFARNHSRVLIRLQHGRIVLRNV
jgi:hypothetical protein